MCLHFGSVAGLSAKPPRSRRSAISLFPRPFPPRVTARYASRIFNADDSDTLGYQLAPYLSVSFPVAKYRNYLRVILSYILLSSFFRINLWFSGRCKSSFEKKKNPWLWRRWSDFKQRIVNTLQFTLFRCEIFHRNSSSNFAFPRETEKHARSRVSLLTTSISDSADIAVGFPAKGPSRAVWQSRLSNETGQTFCEKFFSPRFAAALLLLPYEARYTRTPVSISDRGPPPPLGKFDSAIIVFPDRTARRLWAFDRIMVITFVASLSRDVKLRPARQQKTDDFRINRPTIFLKISPGLLPRQSVIYFPADLPGRRAGRRMKCAQ